VEQERSGAARAFNFTGKEKLGCFTADKCRAGAADVVMVACGIGKSRAAAAAALTIERYAPSLVVSFGSAGGVSAGLKIKDVLVPGRVCMYDFDLTAAGLAAGEQWGGPVYMETDAAARGRLSAYPGAKAGTLGSGDRFVSRERLPSELGALGADACDMEGAAIAHICLLSSVPFCAVKVISDTLSPDEYEHNAVDAGSLFADIFKRFFDMAAN